MSLSRTEENKCGVIQEMEDEGYFNKVNYLLFYVTAEAATVDWTS